jgi:hypothetical protein
MKGVVFIRPIKNKIPSALNCADTDGIYSFLKVPLRGI